MVPNLQEIIADLEEKKPTPYQVTHFRMNFGSSKENQVGFLSLSFGRVSYCTFEWSVDTGYV